MRRTLLLLLISTPLAACESATQRLDDNRGALIGTAVGTGAGLAMKNNADKGEHLDLYTGVGAMAGYAAGKSFDDARRRDAAGITDEQMRAFVDSLDVDWRDPGMPPPDVGESPFRSPSPWARPLPYTLPDRTPITDESPAADVPPKPSATPKLVVAPKAGSTPKQGEAPQQDPRSP